MDLMHVGATWLHLMATVAMLGYYAIVGLLILPVLRRIVPSRELGETIGAVERRALPVIIASLTIFLATGVYLMGADARYGGGLLFRSCGQLAADRRTSLRARRRGAVPRGAIARLARRAFHRAH